MIDSRCILLSKLRVDKLRHLMYEIKGIVIMIMSFVAVRKC